MCQHQAILLSEWGKFKISIKQIVTLHRPFSTAENVLRMTKSCLWKTKSTSRLCPSEEAGQAGLMGSLPWQSKASKTLGGQKAGFCNVFIMSFFTLFLFMCYLKWQNTLAWVWIMYQMRHHDRKRMYWFYKRRIDNLTFPYFSILCGTEQSIITASCQTHKLILAFF